MIYQSFENGDTEYTFQVKMMVGASDNRGSSVTIGGLRFNIVPYFDEDDEKEYLKVDLNIGLELKPLCGGFNDKWDAVDWIIKNYLKGT